MGTKEWSQKPSWGPASAPAPEHAAGPQICRVLTWTLAQLRSGQHQSTLLSPTPVECWSAFASPQLLQPCPHRSVEMEQALGRPFYVESRMLCARIFGKFVTLISLSMSASTQVLQCACGGQRASWGLGAFLLPCGFCCRLNSRDQAWW